MRSSFLAAVALLVVAHAAPLRAQDVAAVSPETERVAQAAMSQLRSPVTPFHTLDMCPDAAAAALRDTLRADAARGLSASQIVEATIARRGEELRIVPRRSGVGLWAWLAPPAVLLAGLFAVGGWLRRSKANGAAEPTPEALSSEDRELLAAEMAEWDREPEEDR